MLFEVLESRCDEWVVLSIIGELDLSAAPRVRQSVIRALNDAERAASADAAARPVRLLLDLGSVDFIDSSGLGIIVGSLRRVRSVGGDLAVVTVPPARDVFALTGLDRILSLGATLQQAIAAADERRMTDPGAADGRHG